MYAPDIGDLDLKYNINDGPTGWRMLAFVREGKRLKIYDDGKLVSSMLISGKIANYTYDMSFGVLNEGTFGFAGSIDEVRLYERALGEDEIAEMAAYGSDTLYPANNGKLGFASDLISLETGGSAPCGLTAADGVEYTLTVKGGAAALDGQTVKAVSVGESVICAVSNDGKYIAMALVAVKEHEEETNPIPGDINGDKEIDNKDVVALFRYVSMGIPAEDETPYDFDGDGNVNNKDVVALFRYMSTIK